MRVLVVTVVHTPLDARTHRRQIGALLDAGHEVVYAAPFTGHGVDPGQLDPRIRLVELPRARRWDRLPAFRAARRLLRTASAHADVAILHDPELLLAAVGRTPGLPLIWDVHEDLAGSFADKDWVPSPVARGLIGMVRRLERWAEDHVQLLLAEESYQDRFRRPHLVVPNLPPLPPTPRGPVDDRVVYLGRVSRLRGGLDLVEVGRRLRAAGIQLDVIGPVDGEIADTIEGAAAAGDIVLHGFVSNAEAMGLVDGALAGLSLLHDHPNYRHSLPTKVVEYQAAGVPVVSTPLPAAVAVIEEAGSGIVVPFADPGVVADRVLELHEQREIAEALGRAGRADAEGARSWERAAPSFVAAVEAAAGQHQP